MPTAGTVLPLWLGPRRRARRFTYRIGEGLQVITSRTTTGRLDRKSDDLPTARCGQPIRVRGAQVVAVWLHIGGQWTEDGGRVGVDVREDRKSTRLNSSHVSITYAVFCLKKT